MGITVVNRQGQQQETQNMNWHVSLTFADFERFGFFLGGDWGFLGDFECAGCLQLCGKTQPVDRRPAVVSDQTGDMFVKTHERFQDVKRHV